MKFKTYSGLAFTNMCKKDKMVSDYKHKKMSITICDTHFRLIIEHSSFDDISYDDLEQLNLFYGYELHPV